ncbi:MAG: cytochrome P450 [Burkholderiaceae bacterium]
MTPPNMPAQDQTTQEWAEREAADFDLRNLSSAFIDRPYPVYKALREAEPVRHMPDGSWLLTRHADLVQVYRDSASFVSDKQAEFGPKYGVDSALFMHHTNSLVFNDAPRHTRVRGIIMGALSRRAVDDTEVGLRALVQRLLDHIALQGPHAESDLIEDFASAIPVDIIGNLLNIPVEERGPLRAWSLAILGALEPRLTAEQERLGNDSVLAFTAYLKELVAHRRTAPGDPQRDVLTRLIHSENDLNGEPLSEVELLQNCIFLLNAGHETTTNLIGNALVCLSQHPQQRAQLLQSLSECEPASAQESDIMALATDEFLRFESSNQLGNRRSVVASTIGAVVGGQAIPAGSLITLCIGAANRDPTVFDQPDLLRLNRTPNKHLAFGFGIHQCAGLSLARLEGRVAIAGFVRRFPNFELRGQPLRSQRARFRGFMSVPFSCGPA